MGSSNSALVINGAYLESTDGTGAWSRSLLASISEAATVVVPSLDPARTSRAAFAKKIAFEIGMQRHKAQLRLHPYAACALDRNAALVVLNAPFDDERRTGWHAKLVDRSVELADRVSTISRDQQIRLERHYRRPFALLTPLPDEAFFRPIALASTFHEGPIRVGYWGGWHPRKGMEQALRSFVPREDITFFVTGKLPAALSDRPDVAAVGKLSTSQLVDFVDAIDVAVYPSLDEGFGLPPYEALLRGKPVVARPLPCYKDFARTDGSGLVTFEQDEDFENGIRRAAAVGSGTHIRVSTLLTPLIEQARAQLATQVATWIA